MARFPWRLTSTPALAALLFVAGCSSVPSPSTLRDAGPTPPPPRGQAALSTSTNAVAMILKPVMDEGGWSATANLPPVINARLLVTLAAGLKSANPGEEILSFIVRKQGLGEQVTVKTIVDAFQAKPYGWDLGSIEVVLGWLVGNGRVALSVDSNPVVRTEAASLIRNTGKHQHVVVAWRRAAAGAVLEGR